jgi:hypothetical protein
MSQLTTIIIQSAPLSGGSHLIPIILEALKQAGINAKFHSPTGEQVPLPDTLRPSLHTVIEQSQSTPIVVVHRQLALLAKDDFTAGERLTA